MGTGLLEFMEIVRGEKPESIGIFLSPPPLRRDFGLGFRV
jgi:hypothetical protein